MGEHRCQTTLAEVFFGIPSGHAQNAVAVWGSLAAYVRGRWAWGLVVFLMVMIGLSRVFLGANFSWTWLPAGCGRAAVVAFLALLGYGGILGGQQSLGRQFFSAFLVSVGIVLLGWTLVVVKKDFALPDVRITNAANRGRGDCSLYLEADLLPQQAPCSGCWPGWPGWPLEAVGRHGVRFGTVPRVIRLVYWACSSSGMA